ncbi:MAG: RnfABCDGE type electron transport complex subunit B [Nitrospinota bacterium]|nr:RnfABCDGE type electron transport complex subunit B [Nitrospinota bacterium]
MFTTSILILSLSGLIFGGLLAIASKKFKVEIDPKEEEILKALPNTNCGACGFPGCGSAAKAMAAHEAPADSCTAGGADVAEAVCQILGVTVELDAHRKVAVIICKGGEREAKKKAIYSGIKDCKSAALVVGGPKSCSYACIGFGTCAVVCPFDAIYMDENSLPVVDEVKCTGCGVCVTNCPKNVIKLITSDNRIHVRCSSLDKGNITRKSCVVGCIACMKCAKACPVQAIDMIDNVAIIDPDKCTNCRKCVELCPTDAIENYFADEPRYASLYKDADEDKGE